MIKSEWEKYNLYSLSITINYNKLEIKDKATHIQGEGKKSYNKALS